MAFVPHALRGGESAQGRRVDARQRLETGGDPKPFYILRLTSYDPEAESMIFGGLQSWAKE